MIELVRSSEGDWDTLQFEGLSGHVHREQLTGCEML